MSKSLHSSEFNRSLETPLLFAALEPALQSRLRDQSPLRSFGDGQFIQYRGDMADGFWLIEEGTVRVGQHLHGGEFRAVALLGPGDSYGELALFADTPRIVDGLSRGPSQLRFIASEPFLRLLPEYPESMRALLGALSHQLQDTLSLLAGFRRGTNPARMAGLLANMAGTGSRVVVTQQELAELLGVTRATANAALRVLEQAGLVMRRYGSLDIPSVEKLRAYSLA